MIELGPNRYGKSAIRVVHVDRSRTPHRVRDLTVAIALEGDFDAAHVEGDNAHVIATDTMKNTTYAFAADHLGGSIAGYARALAEHFQQAGQVARATVEVREQPWHAIVTPTGPSDHAFERPGGEAWTTLVEAAAGELGVVAGLDDLVVLKTTRSAFGGFPRDRYTTLADTDDRMMATAVSARWRYTPDVAGSADADCDGLHAAVRTTLLEVFAEHESRSVQESIWILGRAALERHAELADIHLVMPNLHHWLADLEPYGMTNPGTVYVATREPHGRIEATIRRTGS